MALKEIMLKTDKKNKTECGNLFIFAEKPGRKCNSEALAFLLYWNVNCFVLDLRTTWPVSRTVLQTEKSATKLQLLNWL